MKEFNPFSLESVKCAFLVDKKKEVDLLREKNKTNKQLENIIKQKETEIEHLKNIIRKLRKRLKK